MEKRTLPFRLFVALLSALGFSSCMKLDDPVDMYGTPYATFEVKVNVRNEAGSPIRDIQVNVYGIDGTVKATESYPATDEEGNVMVKKNFFPHQNLEMKVFATDVDGEANGLYKRDSASVKVVNTDYEGGGNGWFAGTVKKEVTITMKEDKK